MKITTRQLRRIIKEELNKVMEGSSEERLELEAEAREVGISEEKIADMDDDQLATAIHAALRL